ncbi:hypothetical protein PanWU01x14_068780 [Parasponia andersonii]|uniref:Uncharacterized protein n=1 Tax=Parasponia andersonii TaxID=3476 RepID=A0A2P5DFH2_PARAD|nr:hypothetical protein PanWU01x14_068780 [Parasponia andersonii]
MDQKEGLLGRRKGRHSAFRVSPPRVGNLNDSFLIAGHQLVHVDPRAGVLPNRLYDAPGLADYPTGLHVVTKDTVSGGHRKRLVLLRRLGGPSSSTSTSTSTSAAAAAVTTVAMVIVPVMVVVPGSGPNNSLRVIVLFIVVVPLRSRPLHVLYLYL